MLHADQPRQKQLLSKDDQGRKTPCLGAGMSITCARARTKRYHEEDRVNRLVRSVILLAIVACVVVVVPAARAADGTYDFYGYVMTDAGYQRLRRALCWSTL